MMVTSDVNPNANYHKMDWDKLIVETIELKFIPSYTLRELVRNGKNIKLKALGDFSYSIMGFEQLLKFEINSNGKGIEKDADYYIRLDLENESVLLIQSRKKEIPIDLIDFMKESELTQRDYYHTVNWDELRFEFLSQDLKFILFFESINVKITDEKLASLSLKTFILVQEIEKL